MRVQCRVMCRPFLRILHPSCPTRVFTVVKWLTPDKWNFGGYICQPWKSGANILRVKTWHKSHICRLVCVRVNNRDDVGVSLLWSNRKVASDPTHYKQSKAESFDVWSIKGLFNLKWLVFARDVSLNKQLTIALAKLTITRSDDEGVRSENELKTVNLSQQVV